MNLRYLAALAVLVSGVRSVAQDKWAFHDAKSGWFISGAVGVAGYVGDYDGLRRDGDRVSIGGDMAVGKWLNPVVALRMQAGGYNVQGAGWNKSAQKSVDESWNYVLIHGDIMVDAVTLFGDAKEDRFYSFIPYMGFGSGVHLRGRDNNSFAFLLGCVNKFRLSNHLDANIELKGVILRDQFDRQVGAHRKDGTAMLTAGFTYNF